jgi:hypothetical protein
LCCCRAEASHPPGDSSLLGPAHNAPVHAPLQRTVAVRLERPRLSPGFQPSPLATPPLASLSSHALCVTHLSHVSFRLVTCAGRAEQGAVGYIVGTEERQRGEVFINDEMGLKLPSTGGTSTALFKHQLRKLDTGKTPTRLRTCSRSSAHLLLRRPRRGTGGGPPSAQRASARPSASSSGSPLAKIPANCFGSFIAACSPGSVLAQVGLP